MSCDFLILAFSLAKVKYLRNNLTSSLSSMSLKFFCNFRGGGDRNKKLHVNWQVGPHLNTIIYSNVPVFLKKSFPPNSANNNLKIYIFFKKSNNNYIKIFPPPRCGLTVYNLGCVGFSNMGQNQDKFH